LSGFAIYSEVVENHLVEVVKLTEGLDVVPNVNIGKPRFAHSDGLDETGHLNSRTADFSIEEVRRELRCDLRNLAFESPQTKRRGEPSHRCRERLTTPGAA
jgi:hypothetical protein